MAGEQESARILLEHRAKGFSIRRIIFRRGRLRLVLSGSAAALVLLGCMITESEIHKQFFIAILAMYAGALLRDFGWLRMMKVNWPFNERIIDWKKVEEIAAEKK